MCISFDTEVILLNALRSDEENNGVDYQDIRDYCTKLKKLLFDGGKGEVKCVSFDVSKNTLDDCAVDYPWVFRSFAGRYYRGIRYDPALFDRRNSSTINQVLIAAAQS